MSYCLRLGHDRSQDDQEQMSSAATASSAQPIHQAVTSPSANIGRSAPFGATVGRGRCKFQFVLTRSFRCRIVVLRPRRRRAAFSCDPFGSIREPHLPLLARLRSSACRLVSFTGIEFMDHLIPSTVYGLTLPKSCSTRTVAAVIVPKNYARKAAPETATTPRLR